MMMMMMAVMVLTALMVVLVMVMVGENRVGFEDNDDDENLMVNHCQRTGRHSRDNCSNHFN